MTGTAGLEDPTLIGLQPGAELWSWDFEQVELQNGPEPVLSSNSDDDGLFDFWQSSFNHGERITAVGASDVHGRGLNSVRTYVQVDNDDVADVGTEAVVDAITNGRAVLSTAAFAEVDVESAGPGETAVVEGPVPLSLKVQAAPGIDVRTLRIFANCDQVAEVAVQESDEPVRFDEVVELDLDADANITVLGFGERPLPRPFDDVDPLRVPRFTTNPVFVDVDGSGEFDPPGDKSCSYPR